MGHVWPMNFAVEVFALHVRNLLDFYAPRKNKMGKRTDRPTDATAFTSIPSGSHPFSTTAEATSRCGRPAGWPTSRSRI